MRALKNPRWHYESRVKELLSFALKIELGRFQNPEALEDFFASTIVVANSTEIDEAEKLIGDNFAVKQRRPPRSDQTHKAPDAFPFDDLRLYVSLKETFAGPPTDLVGIVFEMQIKTFLQHAWSIATHDLLYKTDDANWSKERIAYQIKAMLEHAEISIQEAENLATCGALAKEDRRTASIKKGIALVKSQWDKDELPEDVRRLAANITALLEALRLELGRLEEILDEGKAQRAGVHPANLSPYGTVVQYLWNSERDKMISLLTNAKTRTKILIPEEIDLQNVDRGLLTNAIDRRLRQHPLSKRFVVKAVAEAPGDDRHDFPVLRHEGDR
jgi:ppGpp synthetase/RelA/SpoT-type nucleotidyltranferase